jgi:hypothetical protein
VARQGLEGSFELSLTLFRGGMNLRREGLAQEVRLDPDGSTLEGPIEEENSIGKNPSFPADSLDA